MAPGISLHVNPLPGIEKLTYHALQGFTGINLHPQPFPHRQLLERQLTSNGIQRTGNAAQVQANGVHGG